MYQVDRRCCSFLAGVEPITNLECFSSFLDRSFGEWNKLPFSNPYERCQVILVEKEHITKAIYSPEHRRYCVVGCIL